MKYSEMVKFLNDKGIYVMQVIIADEVNSQLEKSIDEEEFENVCDTIYQAYLDSDEMPDMWELVNDELIERGYIE